MKSSTPEQFLSIYEWIEVKENEERLGIYSNYMVFGKLNDQIKRH